MVDLDRPHKVDDKTEIVPYFPKKIDVTLPVVSESVVVAYHDFLDPDFVNQNFLDEVTGRDGGTMAPLADIALIVRSRETPRIQEGHIAMGHAICQIIEATLFPKA